MPENLGLEPGSRLITTRRFAHKWQDEITGLTELLGGGWSSVSQRRSTPLARSYCLGRRATLYQGCPQIEPYPICAQQTDHRDRKTAQISAVHSRQSTCCPCGAHRRWASVRRGGSFFRLAYGTG